MATPDAPANRLLAALPSYAYQRVISRLVPCALPHGQVIFRPGEQVEFVLFPVAGLTSIVAMDQSGSGVEVGAVGREGVVGAQAALASTSMPTLTIQQIAGSGLRLAAIDLRELMVIAPFRHLIDRYTAALFAQTAQGSVCNRLHPLEARGARWLLMTQDRLQTDEFALTHEFFAAMVGASRPQVSLAAATLQRAGVIAYRRGIMRILDRHALEELACDCYGTVRGAFDRVFERGPRSDP